ncbi:MAG: hypothetical protein AAGA73_06605 [Pseudomonadota bacterium]
MLEKINKAIRDIEETGQVPEWIKNDPATFLGDWYDGWVDEGGKVGGKNRRSIRNMAVWLSSIRNVKSLPQKLRGDIRIRRDDTHALITLFLARSADHSDKETLASQHTTDHALICADRNKVTNLLVAAMFSEVGSRGIQLRRSRRERTLGSEQLTSPAIYKEMFKSSDALVVFSRHRSVANESALAPAMEVFWHILEGFSDVINDENPNQTAIWILDIGNRQVEDKNAWRDFINVQILKAQFEAFAHFDSRAGVTTSLDQSQYQEPLDAFDREIEQKIHMPPIEHRAHRWRRLSRRSIFVVEHLRDEEISRLFPGEYEEDKRERVKDIGVMAEHILPHALPVKWTKLTRLYPEQMRDVSDATFVATIRLRHDRSASRPGISYFAYTPIMKGPIRGRVAQVSLDPPGDPYDEGFRLVYSAARYRLSERFDRTSKKKLGGRIALRYLRKMGFEVLTVQDLFGLFSNEPLGGDFMGSNSVETA